ncbi:hypothetical protein PAI11_19670 [Patulibacter medicamentivorans]|uniref:Uncharacterized protein n=1 Tax=Patulibacter medicamentivorans TaxID=1097667 RepID=H0E578_9ACTN|nr:hypothetical protein PAI11_19670 [Patulibacter medicamentivorans]
MIQSSIATKRSRAGGAAGAASRHAPPAGRAGPGRRAGGRAAGHGGAG